MSIRQELETLLSISQGTTEDYGDYILRVLEEINAVEDSIFNTMTKDTQNWVNDGILAYNVNQPIPEFPKTVVRVKVEPIITPEQSTLLESIFEQESVINIPDELQAAVNAQFESIPDVVSLPEIEAEIQENMGNIEETIPDIVSDEEMSNEEFRKQEDGLFNNSDILEKQINNSDVPEKKKRGRPKGTKNKEDKLLNKIPVMEPEFTENEPFHFEIGASDVLVKKKRGRKTGTKNKPKDVKEYDVEESGHFTPTIVEKSSVQDIHSVAEPPKEDIGEQVIKNNFPPSEYDYKLVAASMDIETGEITPEFELTKKEYIVPEGAITEQDIKNIESELNYPIKVTRIKTDSYFIPSKEKPQKPLDLFRILVCQNYDKPFEEIFKLAENQSIGIKKPTALVTCSTIKATINTLKTLGMLKAEI